MIDQHFNSMGATLFLQHFGDVARGAVAEELSQSLFVIGNVVFLDQRNEIRWRVARQRRLSKMRIGGEKVLRPTMEIGEIASASARDKNLFSDPVGGFEHNDPTPSLAGFDRAHEAGSATAEDKNVAIAGLCHL